ncbi:MAG TPA: SDR family oxidoreductase [Chloroflexota bacterium]|nr:SDR family oxidoreductase [Chloroflexota bacterium]
MFDVTDRVAVVTGGSGVLGGAMARGLVEAGARVCLLSRDETKLAAAVETLANLAPAGTQRVMGISADVTDLASLTAAADHLADQWGRLDILVNAAGGNQPAATTNPSQSFFNLPAAALREIIDLNLLGTILPCQVFARRMVPQRGGSIVNISSMAASRPLTRVIAYGAAKAGIDNFTRWLAVYLAKEVSPTIRVNALAPGFFIGVQNRALLLDAQTGGLTPRGQTIVDHTPMGRFGEPSDLVGTLLWLVSDASRFVTGIVVPVDGGFSAFGGV